MLHKKRMKVFDLALLVPPVKPALHMRHMNKMRIQLPKNDKISEATRSTRNSAHEPWGPALSPSSEQEMTSHADPKGLSFCTCHA